MTSATRTAILNTDFVGLDQFICVPDWDWDIHLDIFDSDSTINPSNLFFNWYLTIYYSQSGGSDDFRDFNFTGGWNMDMFQKKDTMIKDI